jgi:hypothetical protein
MGFAVFSAAALLAACGRQVTPDIPGVGVAGLSSGYMSVKFDVNAPMNFATYEYIVAFNTTGSGATPGTNVMQTAYAGYSYSIVVTSAPNGVYAKVVEYYRSSGVPQPSSITLATIPSQLQLYPNSNGDNTEFTVRFQRVVFSGLKPTGSATPPPVAKQWTFNAFTGDRGADGTWQYFDSMGSTGGGTSGAQFVSPVLDTTQAFDTYVPALIGTQPGDGAATIASVEVANDP